MASTKMASLFEQRPAAVLEASKAKFAEQENAGKEKRYGAVGNHDYEISGFVWDGATDTESRTRIFGLSDLVEICQASRAPGEPLRVLDLGCGDGRSLAALRERHGCAWADIVGVTAEDTRGVEVLSGEAPFDLRRECGADSDSSYVIWNIDDLNQCLSLRDRQFDLIVSWVTWIWVGDPLGSLEMVFDKFLAPGGIMLIGGVQLLTDGPDPMEDQRWLFALKDVLAKEGHQVTTFADASSGAYAWWMHRKSHEPALARLNLGRYVTYNRQTPVERDSKKALYDVDAKALNDLAATYEGTGGAYPLPPPAVPGAQTIPSTRLRKNYADVDEATKVRRRGIYRFYIPWESLDIKGILQCWLAADPPLAA